MRTRLAIAALVLGLLAAPAAAEIYKCVAADGSTIFVSNPDNCPSGAVAPHVPKGAFHAIEKAPEPASEAPEAAPPQPAAPQAPARAAAAASEEALAAQWKRKRVDAEAELEKIRANIGEWGKIATWCNRGGSLAIEDEVGDSQPYDCAQAVEAHAKMTVRLKELEEYLDGGLRDECRKAECLPGWIR